MGRFKNILKKIAYILGLGFVFSNDPTILVKRDEKVDKMRDKIRYNR